MSNLINLYNLLLRVNPVRGFIVCLLVLSILLLNSVNFKDFAVNSSIWFDDADARVLDVSPPRDFAVNSSIRTDVADVSVLDVSPPKDLGREDDPLPSFVKHKKRLHSSGIKHDVNKLLNGLISSKFVADSCLSKQQITSYRKVLPYKPSSYLISKLRRYEALHKRCGPYTKSYNRTVAKLKSGKRTKVSDCKYLVLELFSGLGNRIMSLVSAFLYAMLTDRVLLVGRGVDLVDLFCEPFPESSWILPQNFPLFDQIKRFNQQSPECFGNMLKMSNKSSSSTSSLYVYLHLTHSYNNHDKLFFCDQHQTFLQNVSWVIMKSNQYFAPSLFLMPSFEQELHSLFPDKETVFHFLGTYLLFPSNPVWGLITKYYNSHLARADERIGIQVRVLHNSDHYLNYFLDLILTCSVNNNLLPKINPNESLKHSKTEIRSQKAVLLTSLSSFFSAKIREMYMKHSTLSGEVIKVFQPSQEQQQLKGNKIHDMKAWAEMYLLSLCDKLITSSGSTFGYVAQSIGGLKPWILYKPKKGKTQNPACVRAISNEPCFHYPPYFDCKQRIRTDTGLVVPHVRHCEDRSHGLKLVNPNVKT
ncbi:galactoside 2-alpha-L-fucosyltransferase-like [Rutidosis leptorrhynchoides]|uniref:galactoside 2-alpha-L-fucosyltransferase-like n=1 Tax=Rutidosis leptorrhynchoides TaxID=125765 RepID=UPI003A993608